MLGKKFLTKVENGIILYKLVLDIYEYLWFLFLKALMSMPVHKLLLNVTAHLSQISQNLFSLLSAINWSKLWPLYRGVFLEQQVIRYWWIAAGRFGTLGTSDPLIADLALDVCHSEEHLTTSRNHSQTFSVGHLPSASLVLFIITKLAVSLDNLWLTYMLSLLFLFMNNSCSPRGIKSWSFTLRFHARMLNSEHFWEHLSPFQ